MLGDSFKNKNTPSVIALSRQKLPYINPKFSENNECENGAYIVKMNSHDCKVTLVASGSEVELALDVHDALKKIILNQRWFRCHAKNFLINRLMTIKKVF